MIKPVISVIMPVYNGGEFLCEAIESILNQTFNNYEFMIIDDGSTDDSWRIVNSYAEKDSRIVALQNIENLGIVQSLNRGLSESKGKFVARMDADDISPCDRFERQIAYLDENPSIGILGTNVIYIDEHNQPLNKGQLKDIKEASSQFIHWSLLWRCAIYHPTVMIRKSILDETGYHYEEDFKYAEDFDLWTRLMSHTKIARLHDVVVKMRVLSTSISRQRNKEQFALTIKIREREIKKFLTSPIPERSLHTLCRAFSCDTISNGDFVGASDILLSMYRKFQNSNPENSSSEVLDDVVMRHIQLAYVAANSGKRGDALKLFGLTARISFRKFLSKYTLIYMWKSLAPVLPFS